MFESYLTRTYLKISTASSCRCIEIAERFRYNQGSFTRFLGKSLVIWQYQVARGHKCGWAINVSQLISATNIAPQIPIKFRTRHVVHPIPTNMQFEIKAP